MPELERWVLEGARDGRPAFAYFPTKDHTKAWESVKAKGWIGVGGTTFPITEAGRKALARAK